MPEPSSSEVSFKGKSGGKKKWNLLLILAVIAAISLFIWSEQNRRSTARQLEDTARQLEEVKNSSQQSGDQEADEVLGKVNSLITIPLDPRPSVAKINDIDRLKEANAFFGIAENGDYLILTGSRAILFDPDRNIILDVAPFQVNSASSEEVSPSPTGQPRATATPTPQNTPAE